MKRNKGISMISLIIIIVVTVILIGIATTAGYKYIVEGNKIKAEAVVSIISEAAYRRQNDLSSGVAIAYYEGYSFDVTKNTMKYKDITGLPEDDEDLNGIPDCLEEDGAKWYLFDADSASNLGIQESDRFLTTNISYVPAIKDDEVRLVLADYATGKGYLVDMPKDIISDSIRQEDGCLNSPDGKHNYKIIATCTKPALCIYCGEADPLNPALGHNFTLPTCTASGICKRCGAVDPDNGPLGHLMISNADITNTSLIEKMAAKECRMYTNDKGASDSTKVEAWITDALKHWHECIRCGEKSEEQEHKKGFVNVDSTYHYSMCSECGWESVKTKHTFVYESITSNTHKKKCTICYYEETHTDTGWIATHPEFHYRICNDTDKCHDSTVIIDGVNTEVLFKEAHYDLNDDLYCDICGRCLDKDSPENFGPNGDYYAKTIDTTTSSITVEAFTKDTGVGVDYYQFGIFNPDTGKIDWKDKVYPTNVSDPVQQKFDNLKADTEYTIYVKAADKSGNFTAPYKIPDTKTDKLPSFNGLTNIPDTYVKGPIYAGIAPIETDMTNININYSLDDGKTWTTVPIQDIPKTTITLTKEIEKVQVKITDDVGNESDVWEYIIEKIDITPPVVLIEAKSGDNNESLAAYHTAKVTLSDAKSGMAPDTEVRYAWSTSNVTVPTDFQTLYTKNLENASRVSIEITTPKDVKGNYYLWILEGVKDRVGNPTTAPVCSGVYFKVDDQEAVISNIKMLDLSPAVEKETLFVKKDGIVTVSFEADKKLKGSPVVTINDQIVTVKTIDGYTYTGDIKITDAFEEGNLQLNILNVVSETGKVSNKVYSNDDLVEGPVFFDKTNPAFEYISKQ